MFNDKTIKRKNRFAAVMAGAAAVALAVTFGYTTAANAQIQASVSKPALKTEYVSTDDMINLSGSVALTNGEKKISVSLRDSDIKPALRMIADKAGLNIIFHNSVSGKVTLDLVNVTLNDAFKMVMQACDLSYVIDNGTLIVMSKDASLSSDISKQNMMSIPVKYADASRIAEFLNTNIFATNRPGLSNNKIVVTNPVTNELIIFGTQNDYKMAQKIVTKLDVAPQTLAFRVNHTTPKEMATLVCQSLFPDAQTGGGAPSSSDNSDLKGGKVTGGAASSGDKGEYPDDNGGSGLDSGLSAGSGSNGTIALGEGIVACTVRPGSSDSSLKSLSGSAMTVTYFPHKGTINITGGSEQQAEMIKNFIIANDQKQPQAYIDVQVVDLNEEGMREFQNTWRLYTPFFTGGFSKTGFGNDATTPTFISGQAPNSVSYDAATNGWKVVSSTFRNHHAHTISWQMNYLIQNKKGRLLANPKVIVTNGKSSRINITEDYVKEVSENMNQTTGTTAGNPIVTRDYTIEEDRLGLLIDITPFISPDGYVTLNLKPSFATKGDTLTTKSYDGKNDIPSAQLLKIRKLDLSNVRVKDGETLVIGGMVQEEEKKEVQKIPLLGDLPVIGSIFRNTSTSNEKSELIIMVTPHIIKDTEDSVAENI